MFVVIAGRKVIELSKSATTRSVSLPLPAVQPPTALSLFAELIAFAIEHVTWSTSIVAAAAKPALSAAAIAAASVEERRSRDMGTPFPCLPHCDRNRVACNLRDANCIGPSERAVGARAGGTM